MSITSYRRGLCGGPFNSPPPPSTKGFWLEWSGVRDSLDRGSAGLGVWMALVKLQGNWGVAGSVSGLAWVEGLRFCANAAVGGFGDQKLETKPRSLQDNYQH